RFLGLFSKEGVMVLTRRPQFLLVLLSFAVMVMPAVADTVYANGPVNGICDIEGCTVDAWVVTFPFEVANSITLSAASHVDSAQFAFWLSPVDTLVSLTWAFGPDHEDGSYGMGTSMGASLTQQ